MWVVRAEAAVEVPRVAFAVNRRAGGAVVRNRIRRRLRAVLAELGPAEGLTPALYLVGATAEAATIDYSTLRRRMVEAIPGEAAA